MTIWFDMEAVHSVIRQLLWFARCLLAGFFVILNMKRNRSCCCVWWQEAFGLPLRVYYLAGRYLCNAKCTAKNLQIKSQIKWWNPITIICKRRLAISTDSHATPALDKHTGSAYFFRWNFLYHPPCTTCCGGINCLSRCLSCRRWPTEIPLGIGNPIGTVPKKKRQVCGIHLWERLTGH